MMMSTQNLLSTNPLSLQDTFPVLKTTSLSVALDALHPIPLADHEGLESIEETGEVLEPHQPHGHTGGVQEEATKEHGGDDDDGSNCKGDVNIRGQT